MRRALVLVVALAGTAAAQSTDDVQKAATLYETGKRHFDLAEYTLAIATWREAYRLSSEPLLVFNIAQAYRLAGDCAQANRFYLTYQRLVPAPTNQHELEAAMKKCEGVAPATGDSTGASVPDATPPAPKPLTIRPAPTPSPSPGVDVSPPGRNLQIAGVAIGGAGAIAGIVSFGYVLSARSKGNAISDRPARTEWDGDLARTEAAGKSAQTRARVLGVLGVAALATGVVVWRIGRQRTLRVDVAIGNGHARAGLACGF